MDRIIITLDVDLDATVHDPNEVADGLLEDYQEQVGKYGGPTVEFVSAEWSVSRSQ